MILCVYSSTNFCMAGSIFFISLSWKCTVVRGTIPVADVTVILITSCFTLFVFSLTEFASFLIACSSDMRLLWQCNMHVDWKRQCNIVYIAWGQSFSLVLVCCVAYNCSGGVCIYKCKYTVEVQQSTGVFPSWETIFISCNSGDCYCHVKTVCCEFFEYSSRLITGSHPHIKIVTFISLHICSLFKMRARTHTYIRVSTWNLCEWWPLTQEKRQNIVYLHVASTNISCNSSENIVFTCTAHVH